MGLAAIAPMIILGAVVLRVTGFISTEQMTELALIAGEDPGMITFGAMFLASPVQWRNGRSQIRVRKYLGIVFFLLAVNNLAMFLIETGNRSVFAEPFLIAGTVAVALAAPLFLTSSRFAQRVLGMRKWRLLHKATYVVAAALLLHVTLVPEGGPGTIMIALGFIARIPAVRRRLAKQ